MNKSIINERLTIDDVLAISHERLSPLANRQLLMHG